MLGNVEHKLFDSVKRQVTLENGFVWEYADPNLLLSAALNESTELQRIFADTLARHRNTEWRLIVGFDEYVPGPQLKPDNKKKGMVLSFSFAELGFQALTQGACWFTPVVLRHSAIAEHTGGWSSLISIFLEEFLVGVRGIKTVGTPINVFNETYVLRANLRVLLSDTDGLRMALGWRGAASLKPCWRNFNVWKLDSDIARHSPNEFEICCHDPAIFQALDATDLANVCAELRESACAVEERRMTKARSEQISKSCGFHFIPDGLLFNTRLRDTFDLCMVVSYGWAHTYLQDGVMTREIWLCIVLLRTVGFHMNDIEAWLQWWCFPKILRNCALHKIFSTARATSACGAEKLRCNSGELLGL